MSCYYIRSRHSQLGVSKDVTVMASAGWLSAEMANAEAPIASVAICFSDIAALPPKSKFANFNR